MPTWALSSSRSARSAASSQEAASSSPAPSSNASPAPRRSLPASPPRATRSRPTLLSCPWASAANCSSFLATSATRCSKCRPVESSPATPGSFCLAKGLLVTWEPKAADFETPRETSSGPRPRPSGWFPPPAGLILARPCSQDMPIPSRGTAGPPARMRAPSTTFPPPASGSISAGRVKGIKSPWTHRVTSSSGTTSTGLVCGWSRAPAGRITARP
ncbi:hypothetical protein D3C87_1406460 [compost metagenome]